MSNVTTNNLVDVFIKHICNNLPFLFPNFIIYTPQKMKFNIL